MNIIGYRWIEYKYGSIINCLSYAFIGALLSFGFLKESPRGKRSPATSSSSSGSSYSHCFSGRKREGMDTLAQNPETKRSTWKNLLEAGAITLAVMALTALILGAQYQLNDDYAMCLTVSGAYGVPGEHMIFSSSVLGVVLKALFSAAPAVNWYGWMHFAILFLSGTAFSFLILETVPGKLRYLIALAFAGTALVPDILYMQFTMQA